MSKYFSHLDPSMANTMHPTSWQAIMSSLNNRGQDTNQLQDYSQGIRDWFVSQVHNPVKTDWQRYGLGEDATSDNIQWDKLKEFFDFQGVDNNPSSIANALKDYGLMPDNVTLPSLQDTHTDTSTTDNTTNTTNNDINHDLTNTGNVTISSSTGSDTTNMGPHQEVTGGDDTVTGGDDTVTGGGTGGGGLTESDVSDMFEKRMKELFSNNWTPYGYGWGGFNTGGVAINKSQASKLGSSYGGNKSSFNRSGLRISNNNY